MVDDTELDSLAAQARSRPPLDSERVRALLVAVHVTGDGAARERLVEHYLGIALDQALARGDRGIEVADLYQEGTLAAVVAITEYAQRSDAPDGLAPYIARVVGAHLDHVVDAAELERRTNQAFVRDAQLYELAEVNLRHKFERAPSITELATVLEWPEERVVIIGDMLNAARELHDADVAQYLDEA